MPTVGPSAVARIPTPATDEEVILSPTAIGPFSKETLTGTRPFNATGCGFWLTSITPFPKDCHGEVDTMPITLLLPTVAFATIAEVLVARLSSPAGRPVLGSKSS